MPLTFNLRHLEKRSVHLEGELSASELELVGIDELVEVSGPVKYELEAERLRDSVLVQGRIQWALACRCSRCLEPFTKEVGLDSWTCDLPLEGEERVPISNDCADLTPYVREDILLAFPQHPLCEPDCQGLLKRAWDPQKPASVDEQAPEVSSAWAELNKLKL